MQNYDIRPFDLRAASAADYACLNAFKNILRREAMPDDPPISCREDVQVWQSLPDYTEDTAWAMWQPAPRRVVAFAEAKIYHTGDNEHMLDFTIEVLPEFRRQGLGRKLLGLIADHAQRNHRRLMVTETNSGAPAGAQFLAAIGAGKGLDQQWNQLRVADLDRALIARWMESSGPLSAAFRLGWWVGLYPEDRIAELASLMQVLTNDQPRDELDMEDVIYTADILRQFESKMLAGGQQRWVLFVADRTNDRLAGLTEVFWNPERPAILVQGFTGILPPYRGQGLGRWLKAEMLTRVLRERPQVQVIRTGNATSNAPMLKINLELGFQPFASWTVWQAETTAIETYLSKYS